MVAADHALKFNEQNYINTSNKEIEARWNSLNRLYSVNDVKKLQDDIFMIRQYFSMGLFFNQLSSSRSIDCTPF